MSSRHAPAVCCRYIVPGSLRFETIPISMYTPAKYFVIIVRNIFLLNLEISESDVVCGPERSVILNHRLCYANGRAILQNFGKRAASEVIVTTFGQLHMLNVLRILNTFVFV